MSPSNSGPELPPGAPLPADFFESEEEETVSLFAVASLFVRHARLVLGLPLLAFIIFFTMARFQEVQWVATSRFMTTQSDQFRGGGGGGGLLAQLGQLVTESSGPSPQYYVALVTSGPIVREVARDTFEVEVDGEIRRGTVAELYEAEPRSPEDDLKKSERLIRSNISADESRGTGFVTLDVGAAWPGLAVAVNARLVEAVNQFNMEQRQEQAAVERQFVAERLGEMGDELRQAEQELQAFLEANQLYEQSPRLRFEANRLERQVNFRQQLYTQLAQAFESARLTEVRNTPLVKIVEPPEQSVVRQGGESPYFNGFLAAVVTFLVVVGLVLAFAYLGRHAEDHPEDFAAFRNLVDERIFARAPKFVHRWVRATEASGAASADPGEPRGTGSGDGEASGGPGPTESSRQREFDTASRR